MGKCVGVWGSVRGGEGRCGERCRKVWREVWKKVCWGVR